MPFFRIQVRRCAAAQLIRILSRHSIARNPILNIRNSTLWLEMSFILSSMNFIKTKAGSHKKAVAEKHVDRGKVLFMGLFCDGRVSKTA